MHVYPCVLKGSYRPQWRSKSESIKISVYLFSHTDICWHSYDILSSSILNNNLTEKTNQNKKTTQQQAESGLNESCPFGLTLDILGWLEKNLHPHSMLLQTVARMMEWSCGSSVAPSYWKPAARVRVRNTQEPCGVTVATPATCKIQAEQTTGVNQPHDNSATCSATWASGHTLRMRSFPHKLLPAPSLLCVNYQLGWNQFVLFHSGSVTGCGK